MDDLGNDYEVYIGISEEMMNSKIAAHTGSPREWSFKDVTKSLNKKVLYEMKEEK